MSSFIDKKYINLLSPQLERFKWKKMDVANCRCPLCGDSQKNKSKARGFFFKKKNDFFFKCHNCGVGHSISRFLEAIAPVLATEYSLERWRNGENGQSNYIKPSPIQEMIKGHDIRLPSIFTLPTDHVARKYLEHRQISCLDIFYYTKNFGDWVRSIDSEYTSVSNDERIVIPFFDKNGNMIAAQGRALGNSSIRYITVKFRKEGRVIFGEDRVDYSKRVYAVEGPFDSIFLDNGIALAGCELAEATRLFSDCVIVYDNEPRNPEIVAKVEIAIDRGYTVCVWSPEVREKDINDMVLAGKSPAQIKEIVDDCSCSGLVAKMKFTKWRMR